MSKMVRQERLHAGWKESFVWRTSGREYYLARGCGLTAHLKEAYRGKSVADLVNAWHGSSSMVADGAIPVRVWTRRKPKAPPPLKVGDEVVMRGKVTKLDPGTELDVRVGDVWVSSNLCERVKP